MDVVKNKFDTGISGWALATVATFECVASHHEESGSEIRIARCCLQGVSGVVSNARRVGLL
jgi:hypothetical protein